MIFPFSLIRALWSEVSFSFLSCFVGAGYLGAGHPSPRGDVDYSESLHGPPGGRVVDPTLPQGWCCWPGCYQAEFFSPCTL